MANGVLLSSKIQVPQGHFLLLCVARRCVNASLTIVDPSQRLARSNSKKKNEEKQYEKTVGRRVCRTKD